MLLRLLLGRTDTAPRSVLLEASPGATVADLAGAVAAMPGDVLMRSEGHGGLQVLELQEHLGYSGLRDGDVVVVGSGHAASPAAGPSSGWRLRATSGGVAGAVVPLPVGATYIGRDRQCGVRVDDPEASRVHAVIEIGRQGVVLQDQASSNGTWLNGRQLSAATAVAAGDRIAVGTHAFVVEAVPLPAAARLDGQGGLLLNREPARRVPFPVAKVEVPAPPTPADGRRLPWVTAAVPLLLAAVMVAITRQLTFLVFALFTPITLGVNTWMERRGDKKKADDQAAEYTASRERCIDRVNQINHDFLTWLDLAYPSGAECAAMCTDLSTRLWERSADHDVDFLHLRIGMGKRPSPIELSAPRGLDLPPVTVDEAPIALDLVEARVLGIAGPAPLTNGLARSLVLQLATLHSPDEVRLHVLVDTLEEAAREWEFTRWLPHCWQADRRSAQLAVGNDAATEIVQALRDEIDNRLENRGHGSRAELPLPRHIALIVGAGKFRQRSDVAELLERGPAVGVYAIAVDADERRLPEECRLTVGLMPSGDGSTVIVRKARETVAEATPEIVGRAMAQTAARALSPLRRVSGASSVIELPSSMRLLDVVGTPTAESVLNAWRAAPDGQDAVPVGVGMAGTFRLDLVHAGPHALVAGMTGSGKSEFLQSWIASTALHNSPSEVTFLFLEYKGAAAFRDLRHLPHCVGSMNNLDLDASMRALELLRAELTRRQRVFDDAGAIDLATYRLARRQNARLPALPRLLVVIDEFAEMKASLPEFMSGLVSVANTGRSLGVHLILATQRTGSAVSADIAAAAGLRVSLRANSVEDSLAVLDGREAASIPQGLPGRGYARQGERRPEIFQAARVQCSTSEHMAVPVVIADWPVRLRVAAGPTPGASAGSRTDLEVIVEILNRAVEVGGLALPRSPFPHPLPEVLDLGEINADPTAAGRHGASARGPLVGLRDDMRAQEHVPFAAALLAGHVAVVGGSGSGRSTTLRTTAISWAMSMPPSQLHIYAIDSGRSLMSLQLLPHAATIVSLDDSRTEVLLTRLAQEVDHRLQQLQQEGYGSVLEQWGSVAPERRLPWALLLLDRLQDIQADLERVSPSPALQRILTAGPAAGITIMAASDERLLGTRAGSRFSSFVIHRCNAAVDLSPTGLRRRSGVDVLAPGRAFDSTTGDTVQIGVLGGSPQLSDQLAALRQVTAAMEGSVPPGFTSGLRLRELPDAVDAASLPAPSQPGAVPLGLAGDGAEAFELTADQLPLLVVGNHRTGRSTALVRVLDSWIDLAPITVLAAPTSPVFAGAVRHRDAGHAVTALSPSDPEIDWRALLADPSVCVIVDDVEVMPDAFTDALGTAVPRCRFATSIIPMMLVPSAVSALMAVGSVLLLSPSDRSAGQVYGLNLDAGQLIRHQPGRGYLRHESRTTLVQIAR